MQAHPQSIPAARIPTAHSTTPSNASRPFTLRTPSVPARVRDNPAGRFVTPPLLPPPFLHADHHAETSAVAHTAGLAHDAGNLLGALGLYCDLLRAPGVLRPEHFHYATELSLISSRSSALIHRLLSSPAPSPNPSQRSIPSTSLPGSNASAPPALDFQPAAVRRRNAFPPEPSRPGLVHAATLRNLAPVLDRIAAGAARVLVSAPAALPFIDLPSETLERIVVNLVRNASEAIRLQHSGQRSPARPRKPLPTGEIRVALSLATGRLQLTVEDNGPGLSPAHAAAFLRPTPLPPESRSGHGHRIVHELVTSSGGQLSIRVRPGRGTTFSIKWPAPAHEPATATRQPPIKLNDVSLRQRPHPTPARTAAQGGPIAC